MTVKRKKVSTFDVAVIGTVSAGKSTLINAMIGTPILPASVAACTDKLVAVEDYDNESAFFVQSKRGDKRMRVDNCSTLIRTTRRSNSKSVNLIGDILGVSNDCGTRIVLHDTPGANNARDLRHGALSNELIKSGRYDLLLFVFDSTELNTLDEHEVLSLIPEEKRGATVFVLNKIDRLNIERGETPASAIKELRRYLQSCGFPQTSLVIPTNAELTLALRTTSFSKHGKESPDDSFDALRMLRKTLHHRREFEAGLRAAGIVEIVPSSFFQKRMQRKRKLVFDAEDVLAKNALSCEALSGIPALERILQQSIQKR